MNINFLMHSGSRGGRPQEAAHGERSSGSHYGTDSLAAVMRARGLAILCSMMVSSLSSVK